MRLERLYSDVQSIDKEKEQVRDLLGNKVTYEV